MVKMQTQPLFPLLILLNLLTLFTLGVEGGFKELSFGVSSDGFGKKLFVFGDSYVDTGNFQNSPSFKPPSGVTFPGKPAGRFSDGRVLSDYIASFLGITSPVAYMARNSVEKSALGNGMNFGHGGTGVFNTLVDGPNLTTQIDFFQKLIQQNVYTKQDLLSSVALVNAASNDYATFAVKNGSMQDLPAFSASLVNQLCLNLKSIRSLGISKIAVGLVEPMGCLPLVSVVSSYQNCTEQPNTVSKNHNQLLLHVVENMNREMGQPVFITLDLYNAFLSTITTMQKRHAENSTFMNPLEPCCEGESRGYSCGSVDEKGAKKYRVCEKPESSSFFWDIVHPSQNGWQQVYTFLQSSLSQLTDNNFS